MQVSFGAVDIAQITQLEEEVREAEAELFAREAELLDLRAGLAAFEHEYEVRVGARLAELEQVRSEIAQCRARLDERRRERVRGGVLGGEFVSVEEQVRRNRQQPSAFSFAAYRRTAERESRLPAVEPEAEERIKKLYRQLCRRFHPDLTQDETELACRTERMAAINAAYQARDLGELESLAALPDCGRPSEQELAEGQTAPYSAPALIRRLAFLRGELERIRQRLAEIDREREALIHSEWMELSLEAKLARWQGRDLMAELATDVEQETAQKRAELDTLLALLNRP